MTGLPLYSETVKGRDFLCHNRNLGGVKTLVKRRGKLAGNGRINLCAWGEVVYGRRGKDLVDVTAESTSPLLGFFTEHQCLRPELWDQPAQVSTLIIIATRRKDSLLAALPHPVRLRLKTGILRRSLCL